MTDPAQQRPILARVRIFGGGWLLVLAGAVLCLVHAVGWGPQITPNLFELGVGIALVGVALG